MSEALRPGTKQILLSFITHGDTRKNDADTTYTYSQSVQIPFLPLGLLFWGETKDTFIRGVRVGPMVEVDINSGRIPAHYFKAGRSIEQIRELAAQGELHGAVKAHQVIEMSEAPPGWSLHVSVQGPFEEFCMWGLTYADGHPHRRVELACDKDSNWVATLSDMKLERDVPTLIAKAPRADLAAQLLIGLQHRGHS